MGEASKAIKAVEKVSRMIGHKIPVAVLKTRTSPIIKTKGYKRMSESIEKNNINSFLVEMIEREAFKAIFDHRKSLSQLEPKHVGGLDNARENAVKFAAEVVMKLKHAKETQNEKELEAV